MSKAAIPLAAALAMLSCNGSGVGPSPGVSLSFSVQAPAVTTQTDQLIITRAQLVLRKVELEGVQAGGCGEGGGDDAPATSSGESEHHNEHGDGDCEEFRAGPFLLDVPLDQVETTVTVTPPAGTYKQAEFKIHKVTPADDPDFLAANPAFDGKSIRVEGTFNGTPFVFETDLTVQEELALEPPLEVTANTATNITIRVDLSGWFTGAGGALLDPATANKGGLNEVLVKNNIRRSFKAFEDRDCDGHEDQHGDH